MAQLGAASPSGDVQSAMVTCANGMPAFLATPAAGGPHPSIVVLHERYGLVDHTRDVANRFAAAGYSAIAPNLYWRESDQQSLARGEALVDVSDDQACEDTSAAIVCLGERGSADVTGVVVMGVCATGRYPVVLAAERSDISACIVAHGGAQPRDWEVSDLHYTYLEELIARSRAPVLGLFGELDHLISVPDVLRFRSAFERARRPYHIRLFAGVPHGWLNDTMPGRYRQAEAEAAWDLIFDFLEEVRGSSFGVDRTRWTFESDVSIEYDFSRNRRLD